MKDSTKKIIEELSNRYPDLKNQEENIISAVTILINSYKNGGKLLICGNGGSAADALHIVGELMKGFIKERTLSDEEANAYNNLPDKELICTSLQKGLPAIALNSESALFTAYCNDKNPDMVFAQQVFGYGKNEDVLLAISTSGNSKNIVLACEVAVANGIKIIGLTGNKTGKIDEYCETVIKAPFTGAYEVQERHLPIYHCICLALEEEFFGE